ncbi:aldehyde ferredoxin oxidoreductase family protein [Thalassoroseus pseudoceratinae]|uniref:aldehyde ferredoxin oxidoreductase family protein n=1 Tax=Thalassoroseus pseudoceratinae TaxID=2713176 RepID=UPI001424696C|nr:aldehyde ferredoxin oxidoreductase family protein [Thalassoroseus pseudoceratinae]
MSKAPYGYHGRYLRIDLTDQSTESVAIPPSILRRYLGGVGLGTWLLLRESRVGQSPLEPAAPLIFVFSPLVGSPLTTSAKFAVLAQSPLTHRINDSLSSSHFAIAAKKTGYDAFVLVGQAESLTTVLIESDDIRFEPVPEFLQQTLPQTQKSLIDRFGSSWRFAAIGPAGENLVRYATISNEGRHAGRGGLGAVMGSKLVKAIGVRGNLTTNYADPDELIRLSRDLSRRSFGPATAKYRELGTVANLLTFNRLGTLPTRNFQAGSFAESDRLAPETINESRRKTQSSCAACTIGCEHIYHNPGEDDDAAGVRLEYENLFALGPLCGISDPDTVLQASRLCDDFGLDTISTGGTIAFAMECAERGLWDVPDLRFGNGNALLSAIRAIGRGEGIGPQLALGTRALAEMIGPESAEFAPHVKGLEIPGYEPRALQTMALGFAVGTRGADHNRSGAYQVDFSTQVDRLELSPDAVEPAIRTENEAAVLDSLILCKFLRGVFENQFEELSKLLRPVTGWGMSADELKQTACRIVTAKKLFNIRQGWTPAEDTLPPRFLKDELPDGASAGARLSSTHLQHLITNYNKHRGWTDDGWLPPSLVASIENDL